MVDIRMSLNEPIEISLQYLKTVPQYPFCHRKIHKFCSMMFQKALQKIDLMFSNQNLAKN